MKFLSKLFKKSKYIEPSYTYRSGYIITEYPMTVNPSSVLSLFSIISKFYPRTDIIFMNPESVIEYIRNELINKRRYQPCFIYKVLFKPYTVEVKDIISNYLSKSNDMIYINNVNDLDIIIFENVMDYIISMGIKPGIQSKLYLDMSMRMGYEYFLDNVIWEDFIKSCSINKIEPSIIVISENKLGKEAILSIYDKKYKKTDKWVDEFVNELKEKIKE